MFLMGCTSPGLFIRAAAVELAIHYGLIETSFGPITTVFSQNDASRGLIQWICVQGLCVYNGVTNTLFYRLNYYNYAGSIICHSYCYYDLKRNKVWHYGHPKNNNNL